MRRIMLAAALLALTAGGAWARPLLYVANSQGDNIHLIDPVALKVVSVITVAKAPSVVVRFVFVNHVWSPVLPPQPMQWSVAGLPD